MLIKPLKKRNLIVPLRSAFDTLLYLIILKVSFERKKTSLKIELFIRAHLTIVQRT